MTIDRVCSSCFSDTDLRAWIRSFNGPRGCDACGGYDSPTLELTEICEHIEMCLRKFWGLAVEQLPYESAEGGYQGETWYTNEVVFDEEQLELPRDRDGRLYNAMTRTLTDELWCDWDWLSLDDDVALRSSWESFCETVKYVRRFFFHQLGGSPDDRDSYSSAAVLQAIAMFSEQLGLIRTLPARTLLWRARPDIPRGTRIQPADFGPPPKDRALQSNRMNPPGIPMMYAASTASAAKKETRATTARVGAWRTLKEARILDLRNLPSVPGVFSDVSRHEILGLRFLWHFSDAIMSPVERDERVHIEYLPSQVATEFLRDFEFAGGHLDGVAYRSVVDAHAWNVALFAGTSALRWETIDAASPDSWLEFVRAVRI